MRVRCTTAAGFVVSAICAMLSGALAQNREPSQLQTVGPELANASAKCDPASLKLAIDVGHTKAAPGAISARGVYEHIFNLALAERIQQSLKAAGFQQARLIMADGAGRAQLAVRTARANALMPDLFLSIHHDDVQSRYYESWIFEGRRRSYSDRFSGYSVFVSYLNVDAERSFGFAKLLAAELKDRGLRHSTHHAEDIPGERRQLIDRDGGVYRYDRLYVLRNVRAPAALLEAGILTNRDEEALLASDQRRDLVGSAVVAAVRKYCGL